MRLLLILVSILGLALTVVPSFLVLVQRIPWGVHANLMFVGMILWFVSAPFLIKKD